ncbi:MAG: hypothetical protein R6V19_16620 [Armatimonadota bacterium]
MTIDWAKRKAVVIESDDWGICAWAPDREALQAVRQIDAVQEYLQSLPGWVDGSLETPADLERLFAFLEGFRGCDGRPVVFTACYAVANPDYRAIEAAGMQTYHDMFLDEGVPDRWERGDIVAKAREGMRRGVWCPEFHTRLHHAQPYLWLDAVREGDTGAAAIFPYQMFQCRERVGEYVDMTPEQQAEWIAPAIRRMEILFGQPARCAVNSDATDETEAVWADEGIRCRMCKGTGSWANEGEPNFSHPAGDLREDIEMTYLNRNTWLEPLGEGDLEGRRHAKHAYDEVIAAWENNRPAICSSHRKNYVSFVDEQVENGYRQAAWWLEKLVNEHPDLYFLTSWEVAQMYRQGASIQLLGDHAVARNWTEDEAQVTETLPDELEPGELHVLTGTQLAAIECHDREMTVTMAPGDYMIELHESE